MEEFQNISSRPLFTVIFRPEMLTFYPCSKLTGKQCRILRVKSCFSQKPSHNQPNFSYHGIMNNKQLLGLCLISESSMSQKRERSQYTIKGCFAKFIFLIMSRLSQYVAYYLQFIIAFHRANPDFCSTKYYYKHSGPKG